MTEITDIRRFGAAFPLGEAIADYDLKTAGELVANGHIEALLTYLRDLENSTRG